MPENDIFLIFARNIPCSPSNTSAYHSNHSYTTCRYNAPQCTSKKHPNMMRTYPDRKKAKFPQNKEIITDRTQILTPPPRPKVIAGQPPTPRHATATTPICSQNIRQYKAICRTKFRQRRKVNFACQSSVPKSEL